MKTAVLQSFRTTDVAPWMQRAMASVRSWAALRGYDYVFRGDDLFDLCGPAYLAAVGDNKRSITNLARLEWIKASLAEGYERAIWLDADMFIFDPARFDLDLREGYACGKEVWLYLDRGYPVSFHGVHNAAMVFAGLHPDLDVMIGLIRHIAATRPVQESYQVGVRLLSGLHAGLRYPLLPSAGMLSPDLVRALLRGERDLLRRLARETGAPLRAVNLCWSLSDGQSSDLVRAMDMLEATQGEVINRYLPPGAPTTVTIPGHGITGSNPGFRLSGFRLRLREDAEHLARRLVRRARRLAKGGARRLVGSFAAGGEPLGR